MNLDELKLKKSDFIGNTVSELPDAPTQAGITAEALKRQFDAALMYVLLPRFNELITELVESGAGQAGYDGEDGASAYEIALKEGFIGSVEEWLASLKGEPGYTPQKGIDYFTEEDKQEFVEDVLEQMPEYDGEYTITPKVEAQTMPTKNKLMLEDVTAEAIPYAEVSNSTNGKTITIG